MTPGDRKKSLVLGLLITVAVIGIAAPLVFWSQRRTPATAAPATPTASFSRSAFNNTITGFRYTGTVDGRPVLFIRADRFTVQKRKVGFFRFGLMSEAVLENAEIRIHPNQGGAVEHAVSMAPAAATAQTEIAGKSVMNAKSSASLPEIFKDSVLPLFHGKRVSAISAHPVRIVIGTGAAATVMTAHYGKIRVREKDILLEGAVVVTAGDRTLKTRHLSIKPERWLLVAEGDYSLESTGGRRSGRHMVSDIQLLPVGVTPASMASRSYAGGIAERGVEK